MWLCAHFVASADVCDEMNGASPVFYPSANQDAGWRSAPGPATQTLLQRPSADPAPTRRNSPFPLASWASRDRRRSRTHDPVRAFRDLCGAGSVVSSAAAGSLVGRSPEIRTSAFRNPCYPVERRLRSSVNETRRDRFRVGVQPVHRRELRPGAPGGFSTQAGRPACPAFRATSDVGHRDMSAFATSAGDGMPSQPGMLPAGSPADAIFASRSASRPTSTSRFESRFVSRSTSIHVPVGVGGAR